MSSLARILDLDPEFVPEISVCPEEVDDDSGALAVSEVIIRGRHLLLPPIEFDND